MHLGRDKLAYQVDEAAHATGICRSKIYTEIKRGKLRAVKAGSRRLIMRADLELYLQDLPAAA